jgi:hypothetical protein
MATYSWKDIAAVSFGGTDIKSFVREVSGLKLSAVLDEYRAAGSAWLTRVDTGMRDHEDIVLTCTHDGASSGTPATVLTLGTSGTLTITLASGQSVSCTALVKDMEVQVSSDGLHRYVATLAPTGTVTYDLVA